MRGFMPDSGVVNDAIRPSHPPAGIAQTRQPGPARGVLRPAQAQGQFHHARIAPAPALADRVQHYWRVAWDLGDGTPQVRETLPHPNVHLVIDAHEARIYGVHSGRFTTTLAGRGGVFGVKFRAGGFRACLGAPVSSLRDGSVPVDAVFGDAGRAFVDAVHALDDDEALVAAADAFLAARLPPAEPDGLAAAAIVDAIAGDPALTTVDAVRERWQLPLRSLQRLFNTHVGIGPKWVINRYRMHEALARIEAGGHVDWAGFALALGYFDQAHFIRDFRALVGRTPAAYARRPRS